MKRHSGDRWAWIGLALLLLMFAGVAQRLFSSRYWAGDVYPHFSSLSSAPEGTRALFEALAALPGREVARNNRSLDRLADEAAAVAGTTWIFAGWPSWQLAEGEAVPEALDRLASAGARVVLARGFPDMRVRRPPADATVGPAACHRVDRPTRISRSPAWRSVRSGPWRSWIGS